MTAAHGHSPHRKAGLAPGPGARLLDRAAVTEALLEEGLLSPTQAPIRLARAWPSKTGSLVALYEGGQTGNWALHGGEPPHDGELHQALDAGRARRLIGIPALAHRIEDDPALPAISSRIRGAEATGELRALLGNPSIDPADVRARVVSYKPLRRCVIRYEIASEGDPRTFFGKIFRNGHSRLIWERYAALDTAGPDFAFARPISYESETEMILWRGETGSSLTDIIQTDQARFGVTRAARLLASLHASKTPWSGKHDREREIRTTDSWVRLIATLWPEPGEALSGWWDLGGVDIQRAPEALLPAHRDFYESQVILNGDSATLIDLDTACLAEPELDVANFLAHLELGHLEGRGENPMELEIAFLDAYTASGGRTDPIRLNFYRTSALVRLACVHALRSNAWGSLSAHLLDLARECRTSDLTVRGAI